MVAMVGMFQPVGNPGNHPATVVGFVLMTAPKSSVTGVSHDRNHNPNTLRRSGV